MIPIVDELTLRRPGVPFGKERPRASVVWLWSEKARRKVPTARVHTAKKTRGVEKEIATLASKLGWSLPDDSLAATLDVIAIWPWLAKHSEKKRAHLAELYDGLTPKPTNPDPDNVAKLIADALEGIAYKTDGRIWMMRACTCFGDVAESHVRITYGGWKQFPERWW